MNLLTLPSILIEQPIINILVAFYHGFIYLHIPYALGFAIVALTTFIRFLMYPLTASQMKMQKKMQEMAPHLSKVKEKHKGDMKSQQAATMELYKEHGVNPAAGCLPGVVQIVVLLFGLYPALRKVIEVSPAKTVATINKLVYFPSLKLSHVWDPNFFGLPLAKTPAQLLHTIGPIILFVPVLTALLQYIQTKMMVPVQATDQKDIVKKEKKQGDFSSIMQQQMTFLPLIIGVLSFNFSIGLSLYWNTFSLFGIIQQYRVSGWGGMEKYFSKNNK